MARCDTYVSGPWDAQMEYDRESEEIREKFGSDSPEYKARLWTTDENGNTKMAGPRGTLDWKEEFAAEEARLAELQAISDQATIKNPIGFILSFGVADGSAMYVVEGVRPLRLSHIPFGDRYDIPAAHMRGLTIKDVEQQIRFREAWNKLPKGNARV